MAKSLRSKRKRKMRAIKRERYAVKELAKLKEVLATGGKELDEIATITTDVVMKKSTAETANPKDDNETATAAVEATMDVDQEKREYNKNLMDKFGNYPVWMSQRQIRKKKILRKKGKAGLKLKKKK